jgi:hypothetical protein
MPHPIHQKKIKNPNNYKQLHSLPKRFAAFAEGFFQGAGLEQFTRQKK